MEIEYLSYFLAVNETRNITIAAEKLNISPSALSNGLQKLESELGCRLFDRSTKGMILNENGGYFLQWAQKSANFHNILQEKLTKSTTEQGVIRIGTVIDNDTLFIFLSEFQKRYPGIRVELYGEKKILDNYLLSDLDMFMVTESQSRGLPGVRLAIRRNLMVLMRTLHPLAHRERITLEEIADAQFCFSVNNGKLEWVYDYCLARNIKPNIQFLCEDFDGRLDVLLHTDALSLGYNTMRLLRESMNGIKAIPLISDMDMEENFNLVWSQEPKNPLTKIMADFALEFSRLGRDAFLKESQTKL